MKQQVELIWRVSKTKINTMGSSRQIELPTVTNEMIREKFGKLPAGTAKHNKYSERLIIVNNLETIELADKPVFSEKGSGFYTLYCANGEWRIGGFSKNKFTAQLVEFIKS